MKKFITLLLAFALVVASLTGCGQKKADEETSEEGRIYRALDEIK